MLFSFQGRRGRQPARHPAQVRGPPVQRYLPPHLGWRPAQLWPCGGPEEDQHKYICPGRQGAEKVSQDCSVVSRWALEEASFVEISFLQCRREKFATSPATVKVWFWIQKMGLNKYFPATSPLDYGGATAYYLLLGMPLYHYIHSNNGYLMWGGGVGGGLYMKWFWF